MAWSNSSPPASPRPRSRPIRDTIEPIVKNRVTNIGGSFHRLPSAPVSLPSTPPNTMPLPTPPSTKLWRIINYDQKAIPKESKDSLYHVLNSTGPAPEPVSPRRFNFEPLNSPKNGNEKGRSRSPTGLSRFDIYDKSQREQHTSSKSSEYGETSTKSSGSFRLKHGSIKTAHRLDLKHDFKTGATDDALNLMMHVDTTDFFDNMFEAESKRQRCKQPLGYSMSCTDTTPMNTGTKKKTKYNVREGVTSLDECSTKRRLSITVTNEHNEATEDEIVLISQDKESLHSVEEDSRSMTYFSLARSKIHPPLSNFAASASDASSTKETSEPTTWEMSSASTRQAVNITSNPGYQVMHSSHIDLRQNHNSANISLRAGKSANDLTTMTHLPGCVNDPANRHRRRGSSKGGLAYLASRRGSRESVKSQQSTVFSNEDVGPLTFQATHRGRQRRTSNFLELPTPDHARPRVCSLPERPYNPRNSDDLYRLRTFSISKGTVVNCGDSIISRRSRSNTSVNSTNSRASERSPFEGSCCGGGYTAVDSIPPSPSDSEEDPAPPPRYRVVMLGDSGVGKTALVSQFMTSEYMHTYDASLDDEFGEKTVSVLLDGEESELIFIDHPAVEMSVENSLTTYEPHACVIVYSITIQSTFRVAEEILNYLWRENVTRDKSVILVANMADLARSRVISNTEGKMLAASRDSKFIETSSGIQHNVDELLVGVLKQIRLKETRERRLQQLAQPKMRNSRTQNSLHLAKELLHKICFTDISKSKSCENLHVL